MLLFLSGVALGAALLVATDPNESGETLGVQEAAHQMPVRAHGAQDHQAREEIFEILSGGSDTEDVLLNDHLWQMAGNLAESGWEPPRVTIRVDVIPLEELSAR